LGVLIQIADDWADLWPGEGVSDLARGRKTLPVLYALRVAPPGRRERLMTWLNEARCSSSAEAEARAEIIRLGGLHYVLAEAQVHRRRAWDALQAFPSSSARDRLLSFLDAIFQVRMGPRNPAEGRCRSIAPAPVSGAGKRPETGR
jgi:geranylgeranyl pyrophosphate synthase